MEAQTKPSIRPIVLGVSIHEGKILVFESKDRNTGRVFFRPLGGGIEFGETSEEAVVRELKEEMGEDVMVSQLLAVLESLFYFENKQHHELVFTYEIQFLNQEVYEQESWNCQEQGSNFEARWIPLSYFEENPDLLAPKGLLQLLLPLVKD